MDRESIEHVLHMAEVMDEDFSGELKATIEALMAAAITNEMNDFNTAMMEAVDALEKFAVHRYKKIGGNIIQNMRHRMREARVQAQGGV